MSFGRKGLGLGDTTADGLNALRNTTPRVVPNSMARVSPADGEIARKREAFIAAERARQAGLERRGLGDLAAHYPVTGVRPERSLPMAYLLWFVLGQVSAHRFYLGAYRSATIQVCTFFLWLALALSTPPERASSVGPVLAVVAIGWALWLLGDVFFIRGLHRKLCRRPGEAAAAAAAVFA